MCGIVAAATNSPEKTPDLKESLLQMARRGPDNEGEWRSTSGETKLGHRRLSIIDLSDAGRQPMHNEDESIWLVCNGEIYNFPELRKRLIGLGHHFYSNSDSEVIIHAYEQWGNECVSYLEGMFAFIIWDEREKCLFAARDRLGIKPLCFAQIPGGVALASDLGALLPLLPSKPDPSPEAVAYVMTLGYIPSPLAIWKGTEKLEPGHTLHWSKDKGVRIKQYWAPPTEIDYNGDFSLKKWEELFDSVLRQHVISDVPLCFFLSGGLDSTSIALGLSHLNQPIKALTISFPESRLNEAPVASAVASHLRMKHELLPLEVDDIDELMDSVASAFDEPIGYSALLTMYAISELASREFKAALAGDGGDECFGGYLWHRAELGNPWEAFNLPIRLLRRRVGFTGYKRVDRQLARLYSGMGLSQLQKYSWQILARFLPEDAEYLMNPVGLNFNDKKWIQPLARHFVPGLPQLRARQRIDLMSFCSECILPKVDRASMWHSLEIRVPLLDHRIVEWGLSMPVDNKELQKKHSKPILRNYIRGNVSEDVLNHPKQGFSLKILDNYHWGHVFEVIDNSWWVQNGFWRKDWRKVIEIGSTSRKGRLWFLLMLSKWADKWLS